jgi:hypothetical protein
MLMAIRRLRIKRPHRQTVKLWQKSRRKLERKVHARADGPVGSCNFGYCTLDQRKR